MEAKLLSAASGSQYSADTTTTSGSKQAGTRGTRSTNDIEWTKKSDRARRSNASQGGDSEAADNFDGCMSGSGGDRASCSNSSRSGSGGQSGSSDGDGDSKKKMEAFLKEASSSTTRSTAAEESRTFSRGAASRSTSRAAESAGSASSCVEEDGHTRSSGDTSGGNIPAGTTTDSRGFTTDCNFSGDSGSADSGDTGSGGTGSADGDSHGSEERAVSSSMRVVDYFDIVLLGIVPMAIADKERVLLYVNDAMRGFERID